MKALPKNFDGRFAGAFESARWESEKNRPVEFQVDRSDIICRSEIRRKKKLALASQREVHIWKQANFIHICFKHFQNSFPWTGRKACFTQTSFKQMHLKSARTKHVSLGKVSKPRVHVCLESCNRNF